MRSDSRRLLVRRRAAPTASPDACSGSGLRRARSRRPFRRRRSPVLDRPVRAAGDALLDRWMRVKQPDALRVGCSSARFCAASRRIAAMNASRTRREREREAVGATLVAARPAVHERRGRHRHRACREHHERQPCDIGRRPQPERLPRRRQRTDAAAEQAPSRISANSSGEPLHAYRDAHGGQSRARVTTSISSSVYSASSVSESEDAARRSGADERRVRAAGLFAETPLVHAKHGHARAGAESDRDARCSSGRASGRELENTGSRTTGASRSNAVSSSGNRQSAADQPPPRRRQAHGEVHAFGRGQRKDNPERARLRMVAEPRRCGMSRTARTDAPGVAAIPGQRQRQQPLQQREQQDIAPRPAPPDASRSRAARAPVRRSRTSRIAGAAMAAPPALRLERWYLDASRLVHGWEYRCSPPGTSVRPAPQRLPPRCAGAAAVSSAAPKSASIRRAPPS